MRIGDDEFEFDVKVLKGTEFVPVVDLIKMLLRLRGLTRN